MALSNYDTLSFNSDGKCGNGSCMNDIGSVLEIYKNWAYLSNNNMHIEDGGFTKDVIAHINEGDITIAGFDIHAKRGKQNGIYIIACYGDWKDRKYFGGIGCNGYADTVKLVLKDLNRENDINRGSWSCCTTYEGRDTEGVSSICNLATEEEIIYKNKPEYEAFIGVELNTLIDYFEWCSFLDVFDSSFGKWIAKCKKCAPIRYNQGDAYFAKKLGTDPQHTAIEDSPSEPIIMELIEGRNIKG